ncbi:MAG: NAD(+) synthase [bacterium]|nr:NAD(+) synthase [bacterium]
MQENFNELMIKKIGDFFVQAKKSHAIIALSGGIDSAYSAMLHVAALGKENVLLINLPSRHNSQITKNIAAQVAETLQCQYLVIPIEAMVENIIHGLQETEAKITWPKINQSHENIYARCRCNVIASLANDYDALFPCNANLSEIVIGYGTLYGDISGYACPLGSLWKSEVYAQARLLAQQMQINLPAEIFTIHASAELGLHQDVTKNLGDPMVDGYHEKLLRFWHEHAGKAEFYQETVTATKEKQLENLLELTAAESALFREMFSNETEILNDLAYFWQLYSGPGKFKQIQAPPVLMV